MNPKNDSDFTQFEGAFDFSQAPDPTFAEMLRRRMDNERVAKPMQRTTVLASPPTSAPQIQRPTVVPPPSRRPVWAAIAVLLVLALVGASAWSVRDVLTEGQYGAAPEVVLPVDASVTPGADVELTSRNLTPGPWSYPDVTVVDDVIVVSGSFGINADGSEDVFVYALDAQTGERLWEHRGWFGFSIVTDGETLYLFKEVSEWSSSPHMEAVTVQDEAVAPDTMQTVDGLSLLAIEARSGEIQWEYEVPTLTYPIQFYVYWASPMVADGVVYLANWQSVVAVDATTGLELWQTNTRFPNPESHNGVVGLAVYDDHPVVVGTDGYVLVFAPETGNVVAHHQVPLDTHFETIYGADVEVATNEAGVIAMWNVYGSGDPQSVTMLIDPLKGDLQSAVITDISSGRSAFADDGSVALVPNKWHQGNIFMQILGRGGYTSFSLIWVDAVTGAIRLRTDYVRVDDYATVVVANNGGYACYYANSFECYDREGTRYPVTDARVFWAQISDGHLYYATDDGIFVVELP